MNTPEYRAIEPSVRAETPYKFSCPLCGSKMQGTLKGWTPAIKVTLGRLQELWNLDHMNGNPPPCLEKPKDL